MAPSCTAAIEYYWHNCTQEPERGGVEEHHARGYMLRKRGDFHGAILHYSKALEKQPSHFSALFNRGFSYDKVSPMSVLLHMCSCVDLVTH